MSKLGDIFDFSTGQLRVLAALSLSALILAGIQFIRSHAEPTDDALRLPVLTADGADDLTGVFVLDPNTSPADSLELLPGIGPVLADRIVAYRETNRFQSEIDITDVKGIGPKLYERLKPYLKIRRSP